MLRLETSPISIDIGLAVGSANPHTNQPWQASAAVHNVFGKVELLGLLVADFLGGLAILHKGALTHARRMNLHRRLTPRCTLVDLVVADARGKATLLRRVWRHRRRRAILPIR